MKRYVWELGDNGGEKWTIYVRATENEIYDRLYTGGFQRFNGAIYGYSNEYPRGTKINAKKIMSIREFDKFRHEHHLDDGSYEELIYPLFYARG